MAKAPGIVLRWLLPPAIVVVAVWGFMALKNSRPEKPPVLTEEKVWPVTVQRVHKASYRPQIALYGQVQSPLSHRLVSAVTEKVLQVKVRAGEYHQKGDVLVVLDDQKLQWAKQQRQADLNEIAALLESEKKRHSHDLQMLQSEQSLLTFSQQQETRVSTLANSNLGTKAAVDDAQQLVIKQRMAIKQRRYTLSDYPHRIAKLQARKMRTEVSLLQALNDLEQVQIIMPYDGWVSKVSVYSGDEVRAGTLLGVVYRPKDLEVSAQIPQRYVGTIRKALAQEKSLSANFSPDGVKQSWVLDRLSAQVDPAGGVEAFFRAEQLSNDSPLVSGQRHALILDLPSVSRAVSVPQSAMYDSRQIYRVQNQRLQRLEVERLGLLLSSTDNTSRVLIRSVLLQDEDALLTTQLPAATEGLSVQVLND
jgi:HlyD family secretion protein